MYVNARNGVIGETTIALTIDGEQQRSAVFAS
jgi:hypothetical protein